MFKLATKFGCAVTSAKFCQVVYDMPTIFVVNVQMNENVRSIKYTGGTNNLNCGKKVRTAYNSHVRVYLKMVDDLKQSVKRVKSGGAGRSSSSPLQNGEGNPSSSSPGQGTVTSDPPCAACKSLRRKCTKDCIFLPYFPRDDPEKFARVHKVFGASNVAKMLQVRFSLRSITITFVTFVTFSYEIISSF